MTGEASLVKKTVGSAVIAGAVNHCGTVPSELLDEWEKILSMGSLGLPDG